VKPPQALLLYENNSDCQFLRSAITGEGCEVEEAPFHLNNTTATLGYRLIVIDLQHTTPRAVRLVKSWRECEPEAVILVASTSAPASRIAMLETGVDACLDKPLDVRELQARIRAAVRRFRPAQTRARCFSLGHNVIDLEARMIHDGGIDSRLTPTECTILELLAQHLNQTVPSSAIVNQLWGKDPRKGVHSLRLFIRRLRKKIEPDPAHPRYLVTDPVVGYRLQTGTDQLSEQRLPL
jgi:two-component system, OmpR family, KDP operon response regulator KdpE